MWTVVPVEEKEKKSPQFQKKNDVVETCLLYVGAQVNFLAEN